MDNYEVIWATTPEPGALGAVARPSRRPLIAEIEQKQHTRLFRVRGIISDHLPLFGSLQKIVNMPSPPCLVLPDGELHPYLQSGKNLAFFFRLVPDKNRWLQYVEVEAECVLPMDALLLARTRINQVLDAIVWNTPTPLVIQRLTLMSPTDDKQLAHELILPFEHPLPLGSIGGIHHLSLFSPYSALFREALSSVSPYYRLLCAYRMYEGINDLRALIRDHTKTLGIEAKMPGDPKVNVDELRRLGLREDFLADIRSTNDLYAKLKAHRDGIAHFLLKAGQTHTYLSSSESVMEYALGSAILLRYAWRAIMELKVYYAREVEPKAMVGSILPTPDNDLFAVRPPSSWSQQMTEPEPDRS